MSDTLPNEVREAMAVAFSDIDGADAWLYKGKRYRDRCLSGVGAALAALEAAGFEVNRKGTREAQQKLCNELSGTLDHYESELRQVMGHTNYSILSRRYANLAALLTASNPKEKPDV